LIDGKSVAASVRAKLKESVAGHVGQGKRPPGLAVVLVGDDPASALYVQGKIKNCKQVGIESFFHKFEANATQEEVVA
ncbi:tetrahydrofolate dehydrogenase/cyclohydrolase catalytic domain-containing protein, partial [Vibrio parahaemolyticus]